MRLRFRIGKLTLQEFGNQTQGAHSSRQASCLCLSELNAGQRTEQGIDLLVSSVRVCISVRLSVRLFVCLYICMYPRKRMQTFVCVTSVVM